MSLWRLHRDGTFGARLQCAALEVRREGRHVWEASVARRGVGDPDRVRVQVHSSDESGYNASDWAPGRRKLTPWLRAG